MNASILLAVALAAALPVRKNEKPLPAGKSAADHVTGADINGFLDHTAGWVNAKSHGAKGDMTWGGSGWVGGTDDTAALQAAIDASRGKKLYIPPGAYRISAPLNLSDAAGGYLIEGAGRMYDNNIGVSGGSILVNVNVARGTAISIVDTTNAGATIRNLSVLGNVQSGHGIYAQRASSLVLEDVWVANHGYHGIYLQEGWGGKVHRVASIANQQHGLYIRQQGNLVVVRESAFNNNDLSRSNYANVAIQGVGALTGTRNLGVTIQGCDLEGQGAYGLFVQATDGISILGNYFEGAGSTLLYMDNTVTGFEVAGNYFQDGDVLLSSPKNGAVRHNFIQAYSADSEFRVDLADGDNVTVSGTGKREENGHTVSIVANERREQFGTAAPVGGTWARKDIAWNTTPTTGTPLGWVNIAAGTPGTWVPFGAVNNQATSVAARPAGADATEVLVVMKADGTAVLDVSTTGTPAVALANGALLELYSDNLVTRKVSMSSDTGQITTVGAFTSGRVSPTFGATVSFDAIRGNAFYVNATTGDAFTIAAPANPTAGQRIAVQIRNTSGGALGAVTWDPVFKMAAWTSPATGYARSVDFLYDGANWIEVGRTPADVPY
jgi:hypothetical protein